MATLAELSEKRASNIRKALELSIFVAPYAADQTEITAIWTAGALVIPTGLVCVGMTTKDDGAMWSRDVGTSDTTSIGYAEPTRRDITSDVSGLQFVMQESKRQVFELYHGLDLSALTPDADGNLVIDKPSRPAMKYWSVLALAKDGDGLDAIYFARWLPRASVTDMAEQKWGEDQETQYNVTLNSFVDDTVGTSMREIWGGPGLDHVAMGFPAPA